MIFEVSEFQKKSLETRRLSDYKQVSLLGKSYQPILEILPRLCITFNSTHLKIDLTDSNRHAYSSLFDSWNYNLIVYSVTYDKNPQDMVSIKPNLGVIYSDVRSMASALDDGYLLPLMLNGFSKRKFVAEVFLR